METHPRIFVVTVALAGAVLSLGCASGPEASPAATPARPPAQPTAYVIDYTIESDESSGVSRPENWVKYLPREWRKLDRPPSDLDAALLAATDGLARVIRVTVTPRDIGQYKTGAFSSTLVYEFSTQVIVTPLFPRSREVKTRVQMQDVPQDEVDSYHRKLADEIARAVESGLPSTAGTRAAAFRQQIDGFVQKVEQAIEAGDWGSIGQPLTSARALADKAGLAGEVERLTALNSRVQAGIGEAADALGGRILELKQPNSDEMRVVVVFTGPGTIGVDRHEWRATPTAAPIVFETRGGVRAKRDGNTLRLRFSGRNTETTRRGLLVTDETVEGTVDLNTGNFTGNARRALYRDQLVTPKSTEDTPLSGQLRVAR